MARKVSKPESVSTKTRTKTRTKTKDANLASNRPESKSKSKNSAESLVTSQPAKRTLNGKVHRAAASAATTSANPSKISKKTALSSEPQLGSDYHDRVQTAAYYIAERKNFQPGLELENWLEAEKQIQNTVN